MQRLRELISALRDEYDIGIITLNYDNVLTQACSGLHTGFDPETGAFEPLSVMNRSDWSFIYHLHGSVHFEMQGTPQDMHAIAWVPQPRKGPKVNAAFRNTQPSMEGIAFPTSTLIAGYGKPQQLQRQPFQTYYAQTIRLIHEADSLLFLGYGFGDFHLNAAFAGARAARKPAVVIDWAHEGQDPLQWRQDSWAYNLGKTLPMDAANMSGPGHVAAMTMDELRASMEFEVCSNPDYPLAVWYHGFLAACDAPEKVLANLR